MKKFFILSLLFILFSNYHSLPFFKISNQKNNSTAKNTYIFGHKNPDCDTIFSAIGLSEYLNLSGYNSENIIPCRLGELNKESKYALETFQVEAPILVSNLTGDDIEVILVDHNTPSQSLDSAKNYIIGLIDHHAINGFETVSPIKIIEHPIGSTCSIIYQLFRENNIEISNKTAGLLISGIISDTILLKSSTTTEEDIEAFNYLTNLMGINSTQYGFNLLIHGTDISDASDKYIITFDSKAYVVNGYPIQIASIQTANVSEVLSRKEGILEEIDNFIKENNKQLFVLMIVDIINMDTTLLVNGTLSKVVESAFDVTLKENLALIEGKVSRKHDIYPPIASELEKLKEGDYVEEDENNTDEVDETNTITIITPNSNKFLNFQIKNYFILFLSLLFI